MILVKGDHVAFEIEDGRLVRPRASHGMMQDPEGKHWERCSVLVGPYAKTSAALAHGAASAAYFGHNYRLRACRVSLPVRSLSHGWREVGRVTRIFYVRPGTRAPGGFKHRFGGGWESILLGSTRAMLYRRGQWYRLELGSVCIVDDRGFVVP